jgi:hypothetical protein
VPITAFDVQINGGPLHQVAALIDSGGDYGAIPSSIVETGQASGVLPTGTTVSVYTNDDALTPLYSSTTTATNQPTGYGGPDEYRVCALRAGPVYVSYSPSDVGTTTFDF